MILAEVDSVYRDLTLRADNPLRRFVVYATWDADDPNGTEEVDVEAATGRHAREIAKAALARDYDPGGRIIHLDEVV